MRCSCAAQFIVKVVRVRVDVVKKIAGSVSEVRRAADQRLTDLTDVGEGVGGRQMVSERRRLEGAGC